MAQSTDQTAKINQYFCKQHQYPVTLADYACSLSNGKQFENTILKQLNFEDFPNNLRSQISNISILNNGPYFPLKKHYEIRLETFEKWPIREIQSPIELSKAGFFYSARGDHVICFDCGGGLREWEKSDDPWEQHLLWHGNCKFLRSSKTTGELETILFKYLLKIQISQTFNSYNNSRLNKNLTRNSVKRRLFSTENDLDVNNLTPKTIQKTKTLTCNDITTCEQCKEDQKVCPICRKYYDNYIDSIHSIKTKDICATPQ